LKKWESITILQDFKRAGKLSNETFSALLHTTEALIQLNDYFLNHLHFSYVMLGSFQTDVLERRFGKYRRMSGCNYNVSVLKKKIKINSLIKLSNNNNLQLRCVIEEINSETAEEIMQEDMLFLEHNDQIMNLFQNVDINNDTLRTLIFIASYVG
jgi:hypothetical protein